MKKLFLFFTAFTILSGCSSIKKNDYVFQHNFKFIGYNSEIADPNNDRRSFYRLVIDKVQSERTSTGLESQKKTFSGNLNEGRHLLIVEKWVLDERKKLYVKLNNIEQPKPNYVYFEIVNGKHLNIEMITEHRGKTLYKKTLLNK